MLHVNLLRRFLSRTLSSSGTFLFVGMRPLIDVFLLPTIIVGSLGLVIFLVMGTPADRVTTRQQQLLDRYEEDLAAWLIRMPVRDQSAAIIPFHGDRRERIANRTERAVWLSGRYRPAPGPSLASRIGSRVHLNGEVSPREDAIREAVRQRADVAVWGRVLEIADAAGHARLDVELEIVDVHAGGTPIAQRRFRHHFPPTAGSSRTSFWLRLHLTPAVRLALWMLIVGAAPVAATPLLRRIFDYESNALNMLTLIGFVSGAALLSYLLLIEDAGQWTSALAIAATTVIAAVYDYKIFSWLAED